MSEIPLEELRLAVKLVRGCYQCPYRVTARKQDEHGRPGLYDYCNKDSTKPMKELDGDLMGIPEWCELDKIKVPDIEDDYSRTRELVAKIKDLLLTEGRWTYEKRLRWVMDKIKKFEGFKRRLYDDDE